MEEIAPGYILQRMHLRKRISRWKQDGRSTFIEVGSGNGINSQLFLSNGLKGVAFDLNPDSCAINQSRNQKFVDRGDFKVLHEDFLEAEGLDKVDIVFSSMVIEHLDEQQVNQYFEKCKACLNPGGLIVSIVPANMKFWGIEDEIAGHYKRYTMKCFDRLATIHHLQTVQQVGLTYPLSNILLKLSNRLVRHGEKKKLELGIDDRTRLSGNRKVKFKTHFPRYMKLILNEFTLYPFHLMQQFFRTNSGAMVIHCEFQNGN